MWGDVLYRSLWHIAPERVVRVLHDGEAIPLLHRVEPGGTIILQAAENDPNDTRTIFPGGGAEQRIDGGPMTIFSRTAQNSNCSVFNREVMVRARDIDSPTLNILPVDRVACGQRAGIRKHFGQQTRPIGGDVHRYENGSPKIWRQALKNDF